MISRLLVAPAIACLCYAPPAAAQSIGPVEVVEYRNTRLDHYFMTANPGEIAALDAGGLGPQWGRTGTVFTALGLSDPQACPFCAPVHRFYLPDAGTHFFTSDAAEAGQLGRPGSEWIYEGVAFHQNGSGPTQGVCGFRSWPMYRFYSNRPGDPNHRYVPEWRRGVMRAKGWTEEGVVFCFSSPVGVLPLESVTIEASTFQRPLDECRRGAATGGACLAVSNLAESRLTVESWNGFTRTRFSTSGRAPGELASVGPYYLLAAPDRDESFHPFAGWAVETELTLSYVVVLFEANAASPGSHVYGHPTLEFIDRGSGLALHFSALTFGGQPGSEYLGRDALVGAVIVGSTYGPDSPYLSSTDTPTLRLPLQPPLGAPRGFTFRMTRAEFERVLESARRLEPALSGDAADYALAAIRYKNEIAGNGSVDAAIGQLSVRLTESDR